MPLVQRLVALAVATCRFGHTAASGIPDCDLASDLSCKTSEDSTDNVHLIQIQRRSAEVCREGDHVKCPDSNNTPCAGKQCCPDAGEGTYPCPSAPRGWGAVCQTPGKKFDCLPESFSNNAKLQVPV